MLLTGHSGHPLSLLYIQHSLSKSLVCSQGTWLSLYPPPQWQESISRAQIWGMQYMQCIGAPRGGELYFCFCYSANEITSLFSKYNHFNALYMSVHKKDVLKIYFMFFNILLF